MTAYEKQFLSALGLFKVLGDGKDRMDAYRERQTKLPVP
jgi:hypothetical protein